MTRRSIPPPSTTLVRTPDAAPLRAPSARHLFLVAECERPLAGGTRWSLTGIDEVVVGRGPERGVERDGRTMLVRVADARMSKRHARFVRRGAELWVEDLGSTNGTFVAGERITAATPLADGTAAELGGTFFVSVPQVDATAGDAELTRGGTLLPDYAAALAALERVARAGLPVLVRGESGTGKELVARAVHRWSGRSGAFVAVNCGALPETLVESQLFGHTKGAFSGAVRDEPGLVRASDGGTLFLDEVGDLPRPSQAALLRVLQESEVTAVGATRPTKVDLHVVSATHRPIEDEAAFRADLYARLAGFTHVLLPLRERRADFGVLLAELVQELAGARADEVRFTPEAMRALLGHAFPLNVRELRHVLAAALASAADGRVGVAELPPAVLTPVAPLRASTPARALSPEDEALKGRLVAALTEHRGNVSEVARAFQKTRMQIHRWMKRFGIDPETHR
jgi:transcriptional regulator of acetoin/glycerol metabolism